MKQEDKNLLLKDLCARLHCGVICKVEFKDSEGWKTQNMSLEGAFINECYFTTDTGSIYSKEFKPYLRPMSSMTEEEKQMVDYLWEYNNKLVFADPDEVRRYRFYDISVVDFLNAHHFDYRGLIEKGLALEAPEEMYKIK